MRNIFELAVITTVMFVITALGKLRVFKALRKLGVIKPSPPLTERQRREIFHDIWG